MIAVPLATNKTPRPGEWQPSINGPLYRCNCGQIQGLGANPRIDATGAVQDTFKCIRKSCKTHGMLVLGGFRC